MCFSNLNFFVYPDALCLCLGGDALCPCLGACAHTLCFQGEALNSKLLDWCQNENVNLCIFVNVAPLINVDDCYFFFSLSKKEENQNAQL